MVFIAATAGVVLGGVDKGIEKMGKVLMPILVILIIGISIFHLLLNIQTKQPESQEQDFKD